MTYYIGVDPDLHHAGIAVINTSHKHLHLYSPTIPSKFKGEQANAYMAAQMSQQLWAIMHGISEISTDAQVIIESQRIYPGNDEVEPNRIVMLAQAAGVAAGILALYVPPERIALVKPKDWKGSVKKDLFTKNVLRPHFVGVKDPAGHMLDAAGLAAWGWLRDQLPRSPDRSPDSTVLGMPLTRQRLSRLPSLKLQVAPMPS